MKKLLLLFTSFLLMAAYKPKVVGSSLANQMLNWAYITNSGTPAVSSQSGSWISSVTDNGIGNVFLNIRSGTYSAAPACVCSAVDTNNARNCQIADTATSTSTVKIFTTTDAGATADVNFMIICMGTR